MLHRKRVLLAKTETTSGTDAAPTGAADAVSVSELSVQLMQGPTENRGLIRGELGNDITYHTGPHTTVSFSVELAGAGTAGTAPAWGRLIKACAFGETLTSGTDVVYAPNDPASTLTIHYIKEGLVYALLGARGTFTLDLTPGQIPRFNFTFTGLRAAPVAATLPSAVLTAFKIPVAVNAAHTTTFSLHGHTAPLSALSLDIANEVVYRNLVGGEDVIITNRAPSGSITIDEPGLAAKDFHAIVAAHTTGTFSITHGTATGNKIVISAPAVQLTSPAEEDVNGVTGLQMNLSFVPVSGNDELKITVK